MTFAIQVKEELWAKRPIDSAARRFSYEDGCYQSSVAIDKRATSADTWTATFVGCSPGRRGINLGRIGEGFWSWPFTQDISVKGVVGVQ